MQMIGTEIAKMHLADVIHGDLTTSNMMLRHPSSTPTGRTELVRLLPPHVVLLVVNLISAGPHRLRPRLHLKPRRRQGRRSVRPQARILLDPPRVRAALRLGSPGVREEDGWNALEAVHDIPPSVPYGAY